MSFQYIGLIFLFLWSCSTTNQETTTTTTTTETTTTETTTNNTEEPIKTNEETTKSEPTSSKTSKVMLESFDTPSAKDFDQAYLMGKFDPNIHPDFTKISDTHASRSGMMLRKDTYAAFIKMYEAAKKDGISIKIISATRPFTHQKRIWEGKWNGERNVDGRLLPPEVQDPERRAYLILRWSSMPGTSRHHWGTDIDLNDLNNSYFENGMGKKVYDWMLVNASSYGFCQPYTVKDASRPNGYEEEKWHWSYIPVAKVLTDLYATNIENENISGFEGSETAAMIDIKSNYVLGINQDCK